MDLSPCRVLRATPRHPVRFVQDHRWAGVLTADDYVLGNVTGFVKPARSPPSCCRHRPTG